MLPPLSRLPNLEHLIAQQGYFILHAPRQTGKTTAMLALAKQLAAGGRYTAVMLSVEVGAAFSRDLAGAEQTILQSWRNAQWSFAVSALRADWWLRIRFIEKYCHGC